jgi:hypothetical protein
MGIDAHRLLDAQHTLPDAVRQLVADRHVLWNNIFAFVQVLNAVYREHAMYMDKLRQTMQMLQLVGHNRFVPALDSSCEYGLTGR